VSISGDKKGATPQAAPGIGFDGVGNQVGSDGNTPALTVANFLSLLSFIIAIAFLSIYRE